MPFHQSANRVRVSGQFMVSFRGNRNSRTTRKAQLQSRRFFPAADQPAQATGSKSAAFQFGPMCEHFQNHLDERATRKFLVRARHFIEFDIPRQIL